MKEKPISELAIAAKIKAKKDFTVKTARERASALYAARYIGMSITTRAVEDGFKIIFL